MERLTGWWSSILPAAAFTRCFSAGRTWTIRRIDFDDLELRYRDKRLEKGAKIGYYGGDSVGAAATESLDLTVDVINKDQLLVVASCKVNLRE